MTDNESLHAMLHAGIGNALESTIDYIEDQARKERRKMVADALASINRRVGQSIRRVVERAQENG